MSTLRCKNCGAFFTRIELHHRRVPVVPWELTRNGARTLAENIASGEPLTPCAVCGQRTLRATTKALAAAV